VVRARTWCSVWCRSCKQRGAVRQQYCACTGTVVSVAASDLYKRQETERPLTYDLSLWPVGVLGVDSGRRQTSDGRQQTVRYGTTTRQTDSRVIGREAPKRRPPKWRGSVSVC
jgi:hypothetical protein